MQAQALSALLRSQPDPLRCILGLVWLLSALVVLTACGPPGARAVLEGRDLLERGEYTQAIEEFRLATQLMPTNAVAFNYLGLALQQAGQSGEAERAYLRALSLNHDLTEVHYNLGCLWLLQSNRLEQARSELTTYTLRNPNVAEGWVKLGEVQLRSRDVSTAEKSLGEALRLDPHNAEALNALGLARINRRRPNEAAQFFAKAFKEQPDYGPALLNLAIISQQELNDPQLAIEKYREYIALKPTPDDAQSVKSILTKLEQEQSAAAVRAAPTNAPVQASSHTNTNAVKAPAPEAVVSSVAPPKPPPTNAGQLAAAAKPEPQTNVPKSPVSTTTNPPKATATNPAPANHVEVVKVAAEPVIKPAEDVAASPEPADTQPAEFATQTSTDSQPRSAETKPAKRGFFQKINPINLFTHDGSSSGSPGPTYTSVNEKQTPPPAARSTAPAEDPAKTATPTKTFPRYNYRSPDKPVPGDRIAAERAFSEGVQRYQGRRFTEAVQSYKRAVQLDPAYYDAQYNLALAASDNSNLELALASYENALAIQPESLDARYNFGLTLKQGGYVPDAVTQFEKILAKYPNDGRTHLALGNVYAQQLQDTAKAREHYQAVLAIAPQSPQAGAIRYWLSDHPK